MRGRPRNHTNSILEDGGSAQVTVHPQLAAASRRKMSDTAEVHESHAVKKKVGFGVLHDVPEYQVAYSYRSRGRSLWTKLNIAWKISKSGTRQSPVDIKDDNVVEDANLAEIAYDYQNDHEAEFVNDGVLPKCNLTKATHFIRGGPLGHDYELVQYHFHFSELGSSGSEHALNGKRYPAEVHFVHYKTEYGSLAAAVKHSDGVAVIGALLDVSDLPDTEHALFDKDIRHFFHTKEVGMTLSAVVNPSKYGLSSKKDYFTYNGSLTSPPCCECVCWLLLGQPITISNESYRCLTDLQSLEDGLIADPGNWRPVQPINGRVIRRRSS